MPEGNDKNETTVKVNKRASVQDEKFTVEDFLENAKALGYKKHVLAGAFFDCSKEDTFTKSEVEKKVEKFLGKKVD